MDKYRYVEGSIMPTVQDLDVKHVNIRLHNKVMSVYNSRVGRVIEIKADNANAVVKWADGDISIAPIAALLKLNSDKENISSQDDFSKFTHGDKNPYKFQVNAKYQKFIAENRKNLKPEASFGENIYASTDSLDVLIKHADSQADILSYLSNNTYLLDLIIEYAKRASPDGTPIDDSALYNIVLSALDLDVSDDTELSGVKQLALVTGQEMLKAELYDNTPAVRDLLLAYADSLDTDNMIATAADETTDKA